MRDSDLLISGARQQLSKAIGISVAVAVLLWCRPDLAWALVLGWCASGVGIGVHNYKTAMRVVAVSAKRKAEIEVTEVKPC